MKNLYGSIKHLINKILNNPIDWKERLYPYKIQCKPITDKSQMNFMSLYIYIWGYLENEPIEEKPNRGEEQSKEGKDYEILIRRVWFLLPIDGPQGFGQTHLGFSVNDPNFLGKQTITGCGSRVQAETFVSVAKSFRRAQRASILRDRPVTFDNLGTSRIALDVALNFGGATTFGLTKLPSWVFK